MASTKIAAARGGVQAIFSLKPAAVAVAVALSLGGGSRLALANPTGPTVVNGQVTMNQAGNLLSITNSPNAIINWQSFSIGVNEITRINQQSAVSAILNRVVGAGGSIDPSVILGALQSNGRVFLINPAGIVFGAGSQIDVAGLVASSLNLSNADFLGGRLRFTEMAGAGAVVNQGSINAASGGQVYLVGPSVTNSGIITSPKGEVILAAGNTVELVNPGTPNLRVEITAPQNEAKNLGSIVADAGRVGIYAGLVTQSGTIRADSAVATGDGRIILKATKDVSLAAGSITTANGPAGGRIEVNAGDTALVAGTVEAKGASGQGGVVHVLGDKVGIYGNARVDVSGETGGGTVLAGGELQGGAGVSAVEGAAIRNANFTFFGSDAAISADAIASGDGGKIIVWSDNTTRSHGAISARGGAASGNGGFVETSGKKTLDVTRGPDLRAPNGLGGTWLLDPSDLDLVAGTVITNNTAQPLFAPLADSSQVGVDLINLQLNFGSNVLLTTANQGPGSGGSQQGNITVSAPIVKSASTSTEPGGLFIGTTSLKLLAHNNIVINPGGSITSTGDPLDVSLNANFFNSGTGTGGVTVNDTILTNGGSLSVTGRGAIAVNAPVSTARTIGTGSGGGVSLDSSAGAVTVNNSILTNGGALSVSGRDAVAVNAAISSVRFMGPGSGGFVSLNSSAGGVTVGAQVLSGSSFTANGFTGVAVNGSVVAPNNANINLFSNTGPVTVAGSITGGFFDAEASGPGALLTVAAPVTGNGAFLLADNMSIQAPLNMGAGGIVVRPAASGRAMNLGTKVPNALSLTQSELSNLITSGSRQFGGNFTGPLTVSSALNIGGPGTTFLTSGGAIAVNADLNVGGGLVTTGTTFTSGAPITAGGIVSIAGTAITTNSSVSAGGSMTVTGTTIATNAQVTTGGSATLNGTDITTGAAFTAGGNITETASNTITTSGTMTAGGSLNATANTIAINAPASGSNVSLTTDSLTLTNTVTSANATNIGPRTFRAVEIGVAEHNGEGIFDLTATEMNTLLKGPTLRIGSDFATSLAVQGPISPTGSGAYTTLALQSRSTISQGEGGGITIGSLALRARGNITLTEDNAVGNLSAAINPFCCSAPAANFAFTNKAAAPLLTIGAVDGTNGVQNFTGGNATIRADMLDIASTLSSGSVTITPRSPSTGVGAIKLDLGGADVAGSTLGISQNDLNHVSTGILTLKADEATVSQPVSVSTLQIAPATSTRGIDIVSEKSGSPTTLEFLASEIAAVSGGTFYLGDSSTGPVRVMDATTASVGFFSLQSADTTTGIAITSPLSTSPFGSLQLVADTMTIGAPVRAGGVGTPGFLYISPNSPLRDVDLGSANSAALSFTPAALANLTASTLVVSTGGNIAVSSTFSPATISSLEFNAGTGIDVQSPITVPGYIHLSGGNVAIGVEADVKSTSFGDIKLTADTLSINSLVQTADADFGDINITPYNFGRAIALGSKPSGQLGLTSRELDFLDPASGVLRIGDSNTGNIQVTGSIAPAVTTLSLITGQGAVGQDSETSITVPRLAVRSYSGITLNEGNDTPIIALESQWGPIDFRFTGEGTLNVGTADGLSGVRTVYYGDITLRSDRLDISQAISAANSYYGSYDVTLLPSNGSQPINLGVTAKSGDALELTEAELRQVTANTLHIGDSNGAAPLTVAGPVDLSNAGPFSLTLETDSEHAVAVSGPLKVAGYLAFTTGSLDVSAAVTANYDISATANAVTTTPGGTMHSNFGSISVMADAITFGDSVNAHQGTISLAPLSTSVIILGATGEGLVLSNATLGNLDAAAVSIGGSGTSDIAVEGAVTLNVGSATLSTGSGGSIAVNAALQNSGSLALFTPGEGTITVNEVSLTSMNGALSLTTGTGSITTDGVLSSLGNLTLSASGAGNIAVNSGSLTSTNGALSLTTGTGSIMTNGVLSSLGDLTVRTFGAGNIAVNGGSLTSTGANLFVTTGVGGSVTTNGTLSAAGTTTLTADTIAIPGGSISGANVTLRTPSNQIVNLGTLEEGADFALDQNALNRITTPGTLRVETGTIDVTDALSFPNSANLALRADTMDIGNTVTLNGAGTVSVAPRSGTTMRLGTNTNPGGGLQLSDAEIDQFIVPAGVLRLGDTSTAGQVSIEGPISINPASVGALTIAADGSGITQTTNSTITAGNLRLQSTGAIILTEANAVGMLAGGNTNTFSAFSFTNAGLLTVGGTVDGVSGLSGGTLVLRADDLALTGPGFISNNTVTLAPRNSGAAMNLGSSPGGVFGVDAAELAQITGNNLTFGIKAAGNNPTGPVVVSAPMERTGSSSRRLSIETGATQTVDINAALSAPSNVAVDAGAINVSAPVSTTGSGSVSLTARAPAGLNINAAITAKSDVVLNSDSINIGGAVTANQISGTVTIAPLPKTLPVLPVPVSLGVETAGALSLTQDELAFINAPRITIGSDSAGPITIAAPISLAVNQLTLSSGGSIVQAPDAPIQLTKTVPSQFGPVKVGALGAFSSNGSVDLRAANAVPGSLSGSIASNGTFDFNNTLPMRRVDIVSGNLLSVLESASLNPLVAPKVRITSAPFVPLPAVPQSAPPPLPPSQFNPLFEAQLLASIDKLSDINDALDATSEEDKKNAEKEKKKQQECK